MGWPTDARIPSSAHSTCLKISSECNSAFHSGAPVRCDWGDPRPKIFAAGNADRFQDRTITLLVSGEREASAGLCCGLSAEQSIPGSSDVFKGWAEIGVAAPGRNAENFPAALPENAIAPDVLASELTSNVDVVIAVDLDVELNQSLRRAA